MPALAEDKTGSLQLIGWAYRSASLWLLQAEFCKDYFAVNVRLAERSRNTYFNLLADRYEFEGVNGATEEAFGFIATQVESKGKREWCAEQKRELIELGHAAVFPK
jgi:DNA modification methylase